MKLNRGEEFPIKLLIRCGSALVGTILFVFLFSSGLPASRRGELPRTSAAPLQVGEELHYDIRWGFIPAGEGTLRISAKEAEKEGIYHIITTARSNAFVDTFYKVRNRIESFLDMKNDSSAGYRKSQREGRHHRDVDLVFDHEKNEATLIKNGVVEKTIRVPRRIHDPLSAIYYLRTVKNLETEPVLNVTDGRKNYRVRIRNLGREHIKTPLGYFDTIKVEPIVEDMELIFDKKKGGKLLIWLTDDEKKVPVKMKSELLFGSIQVLLTDAKINPAGRCCDVTNFPQVRRTD